MLTRLPNAGDALQAVVMLLKTRDEFTTNEIQRNTPAFSRKRIHNAIGYLARRGHIKRLSYGRYKIVPTERTVKTTLVSIDGDELTIEYKLDLLAPRSSDGAIPMTIVQTTIKEKTRG